MIWNEHQTLKFAGLVFQWLCGRMNKRQKYSVSLFSCICDSYNTQWLTQCKVLCHICSVINVQLLHRERTICSTSPKVNPKMIIIIIYSPYCVIIFLSCFIISPFMLWNKLICGRDETDLVSRPGWESVCMKVCCIVIWTSYACAVSEVW